MRSQGRNLRKGITSVHETKEKTPVPPTDPKLPQQKIPPPPVSRLLPNPTFPKTNDIDLNIDFDSVLEKINVTVPLKEIIKIPSMRSRLKDSSRYQVNLWTLL
jgi:hypothetical protein